jgi:signal transduction histidine kinase
MMRLQRLASLFYTPDDDEPIRIERAVVRLRVALASGGLIAITADPGQPALYSTPAYSILIAYAVLAVFALMLVPRTPRQARWLGWISHLIDVGACACLTLVTGGANSPYFLLLTFPLLTAAYRWGLLENLISAAIALAILAADAVLPQSQFNGFAGISFGELQPGRLIIRTIYLVLFGVALGYLADKDRQRRRESAALVQLIREAKLDAGLAGTLHSLLAAIAKTFSASRALLVVEEVGSGRTFLLDARTGLRKIEGAVTSSELSEAERDAYLFDFPGQSWYAVDRSPLEGFSITAVDEDGKLVNDPLLSLPFGFTVRYPCRSLLAVNVGLDTDWSGRLMLLNPQVGLDRVEAVQFVQRLVRDVGPAVRQTSVIHRLRRRAERIERLRLARELHDGPIQTVSAAVMQIELMRRRPSVDGPLAEDLEAVESLLRDEIANLRDMTQDMRLGVLETDSTHLVRELAQMVDRFARQHNITAHFVSDEDFIHVSTLARRELLRVLHEALVNVRKHSGATETLVWLRLFGDRLILSVEDNGRGFSFDGRLTHEELEAREVGPVVIRERMAAIGGELAVESRPGHGARLELRLPLAATRTPVSRL